MSATIELFEQYKLHIGVQADRLAAQELGVKSQTVSNWRTRGSQAEPWLIESMCTKLKCDATPWLIRTLAEQAAGARNRAVWEHVGKALKSRFLGIIALLGLPTALLLDGSVGMRETLVADTPSWQVVCALFETLFA